MLVAGIGNLFCGDDGFGPEVVRRLAAAGPLPEGVRAVDYGIRGMHLAYDLLEGYDALVIVDALCPPGSTRGGSPSSRWARPTLGEGGSTPTAWRRWPSSASLAHSVVASPRPTSSGCPPPVLEDGIGLSAPVEAAVPEAMRTVLAVLARARPRPGGRRPTGAVAEMCLGIPGQVVRGPGGQRRDARSRRRPRRPAARESRDARGLAVEPGEWVLIHMGFVVERVDATAAEKAMTGLELMGRERDG